MSQSDSLIQSEKSVTDDLERILFDETAIRERVSAIASQINRVYAGNKLTVIAVANGAVVFAADLIRKLNLPVRFDCIHVSSYRNQTTPTNSPKILNHIQLDIKGANVLLVDDILDTGNTLSDISKQLWSMQPNSLKTCVLLDKKSRRSVDIEADFTGFEIPDEFVVGFGLDFAESYRQLPYIGVLKKELTQI